MTKSYVTELPLAEPVGDAAPGTPAANSPTPVPELLVDLLSGTYEPRLSPSQWHHVVAAAIDRNLAPLLFSRLKQNDALAGVPSDEKERLQRAFLVSVGKSARLQRGLAHLLRSLNNHGLPAIVLKGAYLAEAVYGDVALRPMGDVDLLVREPDLERAQAVLLEMGGVHRQYDDSEADPGWRRHLPHTTIGRLVVELHWNIMSPAGPVRVDVAGLWERACPASIAGVETLGLAPEDLMLHLCLHTCYEDRLADLRGLVDVTETARRFGGQFDWDRFAARAREWGAPRYAALTLHLARAMLGADVPDGSLELLVPAGIDPAVVAAAKQSLLDQTGFGRWLTYFDAARAKTFAEKARLSWRRVFLSHSEMAATYPSYRSAVSLPWYYGRRVVDLGWRYVSHSRRRRRLLRQDGHAPHAALVRWLSGES
jgi:hypothetical protein